MENRTNLGLRRDIVELIDHSPLWECYANETITELKSIFGNKVIDIQHVGSTAIKGIKAKPIIDIVVGLDELNELAAFMSKLAERKYFHRPFKGDDVIFFKENSEDTRTHHIHVVKYRSDAWNNQINFRDYLNCHIAEAKNYEQLKIELQKDNRDNRKNYTEKKVDYIVEMIHIANKWKNSSIK